MSDDQLPRDDQSGADDQSSPQLGSPIEKVPSQTAAESSDFDAYRDDLRKAERKVAGEIDPGARAVVVAVAVLVAILSMVLPHTGHASGIDVLAFTADSDAERITITSRVFVYLLVIFGIGMSMLALVSRRWVLAWIALCGSAVGCFYGLLAWWSRNTPGVGGIAPPHGVGVGLVLGWIALLVIAFHWARVVWARTNYHLALEAGRRAEAKKAEDHALSLQHRLSRGTQAPDSPDA